MTRALELLDEVRNLIDFGRTKAALEHVGALRTLLESQPGEEMVKKVAEWLEDYAYEVEARKLAGRNRFEDARDLLRTIGLPSEPSATVDSVMAERADRYGSRLPALITAERLARAMEAEGVHSFDHHHAAQCILDRLAADSQQEGE